VEAVLRLLVLFVTVPLLELYLLVRIGEAIGLGPTIGLVLVTGALGASLARAQGLATWARFQRTLAAGGLPAQELVEGLLILVAGAVLLTPGVLTDAVGFLLLVPRVRRRLVERLEERLRGRVDLQARAAQERGRDSAGDDAIDAEYEVRDREP
jgi:UPF0716 protein FxsA